MSLAELHSTALRAAAFDALDVEAVVLDRDGTIVETNLSWLAFAGHNGGAEAATGVGVNYLDVCDRSAAAGSPGAAEVAAGLRRLLAGDEDRVELGYLCPTATDDRWFVLRAVPIHVGEWPGAVVFHRDESVRQQLWDELRAPVGTSATADAVATFTHASDLLLSVAIDGTIQVASPACEAMFGVAPAALVGTNGFDLIHPADRESARLALEAAVAGDDRVVVRFRVADASGATVWLEGVGKNMLHDPQIGGVVGSLRDVTERVRQLERSEVAHHEAVVALAHQASYDLLTQLPNAASLHELLLSALADAPTGEMVAVAMLDIDHFKSINDRSGRAHGDEVLRAVAARLTAEMPASDAVARLASDEFVVVRRAVADLDGAGAMGDDILRAMLAPLALADRALHQTVSVGVALSTAGDTPVSILHDADDAMYQSKRDGRNRATVFGQSARLRSHRRQHLAGALSVALERAELHVEYQPIFELCSSAVVGFEALLRWQHPTLGRIAADEFIPLAEATGLIVPMADWAFEQAMAQLAEWRARPEVRPDLWMSLNVSGAQLAQRQLAGKVRAMLDAAGLPPDSIHLEISERVLMDGIESSPESIADLQALGVGVSIDDFGTGSSSLSYLSGLPVDTIKIDRSFVRQLRVARTKGSGRAPGAGDSIIRAIVALAGTLDLVVVAEGIETEEQLAIVRDIGCRLGQGFLWSRAMRADAALAWMTQRSGVDRLIAPAVTPPPVREDFGTALLGIARGATGRQRTARERASVVRFGTLEVCSLTKRAWLGGRDLQLTDMEFDLLAFLTAHEGTVFSPTDLLREVWHSSPTWQSTATVAEHIHRLRRRIEVLPARPTLIHTVRGRGYRFGSDET